MPKSKSKSALRRRAKKHRLNAFHRTFQAEEPKLFEPTRPGDTGRAAERWQLIDVLRRAGCERAAYALQYWEGDVKGAFFLARDLIRKREESAREEALRKSPPALLLSRRQLTLMQRRQLDAARFAEIVRHRPLKPPSSSA